MDNKQLVNLYRASKHCEYVVGEICKYYLEWRKERARKGLGAKDTDELWCAMYIKKCFGVLQGMIIASGYRFDYWKEIMVCNDAIPEALDYEDGDDIDNIYDALMGVEEEINDYIKYLKKGE